MGKGLVDMVLTGQLPRERVENCGEWTWKGNLKTFSTPEIKELNIKTTLSPTRGVHTCKVWSCETYSHIQMMEDKLGQRLWNLIFQSPFNFQCTYIMF